MSKREGQERIRIWPKAIVVLLFLSFTAIYSLYNVASTPQNPQVEPQKTILQGSSSSSPVLGNKSVAPPPPTGQKEVSEPEPQRRLIGATDEQVKNIEQFLPPGSQIYLSPIGSDESKAAVAEADLDADGIVETIVVHRWRMPTQRDATPPLSLSVLNSSGRASSGIVSVSLEGGVLFNIELSGKSIPLVVKDLTGDHVPEIVVASGIGASLGGVLHVFRLQGSSLVAVLKLDGNAFRITQSGLITAQSRYQKKAASYRWNGQRFVLLGEDF